jgi:hypothetical protein
VIGREGKSDCATAGAVAEMLEKMKAQATNAIDAFIVPSIVLSDITTAVPRWPICEAPLRCIGVEIIRHRRRHSRCRILFVDEAPEAEYSLGSMACLIGNRMGVR